MKVGSSGARRRWRAVVAALSLALVMPAASLRAAPAAGRVVKLVYARAPEAARCPGQDEIERQVRARLGYEPFAPDASSTLRASIRTAGRGLQARIELRGPDGKVEGVREIDSPEGDCDELTASVAFAVSMAIDPLAAVRAPASARPQPSPPVPARPESSSRASTALSSSSPARVSPPASASSAAPPSRVVPAASSAPVPSARPTTLAVSGGVLIVSGQAPDLSAGLSLGFDARRSWASLAIEARFLSATKEIATDRGISSSLTAGVLVPCVYVRRLFGCAVGMLGLMQGKDYGVETVHRDRLLFAAAGGRVGLHVVLDEPLWVRVSGELLVNLTPATLTLNRQPAWSSPLLTGVAGLILGVSF